MCQAVAHLHGSRLAAFVVPHDGVSGVEREHLAGIVISHAERILPRPFVPATVVVLEAMPLTATGTVMLRHARMGWGKLTIGMARTVPRAPTN